MKKTKILATIGPSTLTFARMQFLVEAGVNAFRINAAHGDFTQYDEIVKNAARLRTPVVLDIKGPELRIKTPHAFPVKPRDEIIVSCNQNDPTCFSVNVYKDLKVGDVVFIENGKLKTIVKKKVRQKVFLEAKESGMIRPNKGVNVPGRKLNIPSLTKQDHRMLEYAKKKYIPFIAISFVRSAQDIQHVKEHYPKANIIAKIENQEGIDNIDAIIRASEGIMVARGDLGIEIPAQNIPLLQKDIVKRCNASGKISIIATQMLESMIDHSTPTRAETSDVANAVLDGADCVMLSGETAIGQFPVKTVSVMHKILVATEKARINPLGEVVCRGMSDAISKAAADIASCLPISKVVAVTSHGATAQFLSRFRIQQPLIGVTGSEKTFALLHLYYGMTPFLLRIPKKQVILKVAKALVHAKAINTHDQVLFTAGVHTQKERQSNLIEVHDIQDLMRYAR